MIGEKLAEEELSMGDLYDHEEDWSESFDDMELGDWEDYLGGPDDKEIEESYYSASN